MRAVLVRTVEAALLHSGFAAVARRRLRGKAIVLAFHNVVPDGAPPLGDRSLHLGLSRFRAVLDTVLRLADVVPLAEVHDRPSDARAAVALTFDDCYAGFVELAVPELVARGVPATVFVAPGILGGRTMWWDALASASGLDPAVRDEALQRLHGDDVAIRAWAERAAHPLRDLPELWRTASHEACVGLTRRDGIRLASHSWSHPNLSALPDAAAQEELVRSKAWLRALACPAMSRDLDAVAYPYGLVPSHGVRAALRSEKCHGFRVSGGWLDPRSDDTTLLPRLNVPTGLSSAGLALRLSGLLVRS